MSERKKSSLITKILCERISSKLNWVEATGDTY